MNWNKSIFSASCLALMISLQPVTSEAAEPSKTAVAQPSDMNAFLKAVGKKASSFRTLKTDFVQEKKMVMFKEKLILKGRIYLEKPNKIAWHVDSPVRYSVLMTDKFIRQWDEDTNKVQELSLKGNPVFQNVLSQLNVWFSGEYGSLLETNDVKILKKEPLVLEFIPRDNNFSKKIIKGITITFRNDQNYLQQLKIQERSGDTTTINFMNTVLNSQLDSRNFEVK